MCIIQAKPLIVCLRDGHNSTGGSDEEWSNYKHEFFPDPPAPANISYATIGSLISIAFLLGAASSTLTRGCCARLREAARRRNYEQLEETTENPIYHPTVEPADQPQRGSC